MNVEIFEFVDISKDIRLVGGYGSKTSVVIRDDKLRKIVTSLVQTMGMEGTRPFVLQIEKTGVCKIVLKQAALEPSSVQKAYIKWCS